MAGGRRRWQARGAEKRQMKSIGVVAGSQVWIRMSVICERTLESYIIRIRQPPVFFVFACLCVLRFRSVDWNFAMKGMTVHSVTDQKPTNDETTTHNEGTNKGRNKQPARREKEKGRKHSGAQFHAWKCNRARFILVYVPNR